MPLLDPREFRGTNYAPSISRAFCADLGLIPWTPGSSGPTEPGGFFVPSHCQQEISTLAAHGINSIRVIGSFYGWLADKDAYMQSLGQLAIICAQYGVAVTYVLWSTTPAGDGTAYFPLPELRTHQRESRNPGLLSQLFRRGLSYSESRRFQSRGRIPVNEEDMSMYPAPGPDWLFDYPGGYAGWNALGVPLFDYVNEYLLAICQFFVVGAGRHALGSIDLYNEPDVLITDPSRGDQVLSFIKYTYDIVRDVIPNVLCTVGLAGLISSDGLDYNRQLEDVYDVEQGYYSFHCYADPVSFPQILQVVKTLMPNRSKTIVCSEFWVARFRGFLRRYTQDLARNGFGGQMWGFMQYNAYWGDGREIDGVIAPDPALSISESSQIGFSVINNADLDGVHLWKYV